MTKPSSLHWCFCSSVRIPVSMLLLTTSVVRANRPQAWFCVKSGCHLTPVTDRNWTRTILRDQRLLNDGIPCRADEALVETLVTVAEMERVHAHLVENGRLQVADGDRIF